MLWHLPGPQSQVLRASQCVETPVLFCPCGERPSRAAWWAEAAALWVFDKCGRGASIAEKQVLPSLGSASSGEHRLHSVSELLQSLLPAMLVGVEGGAVREGTMNSSESAWCMKSWLPISLWKMFTLYWSIVDFQCCVSYYINFPIAEYFMLR